MGRSFLDGKGGGIAAGIKLLGSFVAWWGAGRKIWGNILLFLFLPDNQ